MIANVAKAAGLMTDPWSGSLRSPQPSHNQLTWNGLAYSSAYLRIASFSRQFYIVIWLSIRFVCNLVAEEQLSRQLQGKHTGLTSRLQVFFPQRALLVLQTDLLTWRTPSKPVIYTHYMSAARSISLEGGQQSWKPTPDKSFRRNAIVLYHPFARNHTIV